MEIEMKYSIPSKERADEIWSDAYLEEIAEADSRQTAFLKSVYFDTEDNVLRNHDIAFRVRTRGAGCVASLKWNGTCDGPLHVREEINVPVGEETCLLQPSPEIFKESETGRQVMELLGDQPLCSLFEMHFLRRTVRVDTGSSIFELSIDVGEIVAEGGSQPICEAEIELFSGDQENMMEFAGALAERFGLEPESCSKYARGLSLI